MSENEKKPRNQRLQPEGLFDGEEQEQEQQQEQPKTRRQRMTKAEVKQYVDWCFSDSLKDEIPIWNNKKIITEYEKVSGRKLSHQFIAAQKKKWMLVNGEVVRNS